MTENQEVTFALSDLKEILVKVSNALEAISKISETLREYITKLLSLERFVGEIAQKLEMLDRATAQGFAQVQAKLNPTDKKSGEVNSSDLPPA